MYIYFDKNGTLKEIINDDALRVGNSEVNTIYAFWEKEEGNTESLSTITNAYIRYKLPDNSLYPVSASRACDEVIEDKIPYDKHRDLKFFEYFKNYKYLYGFYLPDEILSYSGVVSASISFTLSDGRIYEMGLITFMVSSSVDEILPDEHISISQFNYLKKIVTVNTFNMDGIYNEVTKPDGWHVYELLNDKERNLVVDSDGVIYRYSKYESSTGTYEFSSVDGQNKQIKTIQFFIDDVYEYKIGNIISNIKDGIGSKSIQQNDGTTTFTNNYAAVGINIEEYVSPINNEIIVDSSTHKLTVTNGAFGAKSTVLTGKSLAHGERALAYGTGTLAIGNYSHSEGNASVARANMSHAEGLLTVAYGVGSHSEGNGSVATGQFSHSEGSGTFTTGSYSHAEGDHTQATGEASHSEGGITIASGPYSHAEGSNNTASGSSSHVEGLGNTASGNVSHVEGQYNDANGKYAVHIEGLNNIASKDFQTIVGQYNDYEHDSNALFAVGSGNSEVRRDAFQVLYDGTILIQNFNTSGDFIGYKRMKCVNGVLTIID